MYRPAKTRVIERESAILVFRPGIAALSPRAVDLAPGLAEAGGRSLKTLLETEEDAVPDPAEVFHFRRTSLTTRTSPNSDRFRARRYASFREYRVADRRVNPHTPGASYLPFSLTTYRFLGTSFTTRAPGRQAARARASGRVRRVAFFWVPWDQASFGAS